MVSESLPLTFTAIDFETANYDRDSVCSVGLAVVKDGEVVSKHGWLVRPPELRFEEFFMERHRITASMVRDEPEFPDIWPAMKRRIVGPLVAHNASFDVSVLRHTLDRYEIPHPRVDYFCSLCLAREQWPELPRHSLDALAEHLGISLVHHQADQDAHAAAMVVVLAARQSALSCLMELLAARHVALAQFCPAEATPYRHREPRGSGSRRNYPSYTSKPSDLTPQRSEFDQRHPLFGKTVVFTGTLQTMPRIEAWQAVVDSGGKVLDSIRRGVDYLVAGEQDPLRLAEGQDKSGKERKAEELRAKGHHIETVSESEFRRLLYWKDDAQP